MLVNGPVQLANFGEGIVHSDAQGNLRVSALSTVTLGSSLIDADNNKGEPGEVLINVDGKTKWVNSQQLVDVIENSGSITTVGSDTVVSYTSNSGPKWFIPSVYTTSIDVLVVGAGGNMGLSNLTPSGGGQVVYHQNYAVTPGTRYLIRVAKFGTQESSLGTLWQHLGRVGL